MSPSLTEIGGYEIVKKLGEGGMGVVYLAVDRRTSRRVAIKVMKEKLEQEEKARERFLREATAMANIQSPHIIQLFHVGEESGRPYFVMEYLEGRSLQNLFQSEQKIPISLTLRIAKQICRGLESAHQRGIVHRDIKPDNIFLIGPSPQVKILDFGLARHSENLGSLTQTGAVLGTPYYMSPEQAEGKQVDFRADLFSLGVVLYQLCARELPFQGDTLISIVYALANHQPPPVKDLNPEVPPWLSDLIQRLIAKNPKQRPQSIREVLDELVLDRTFHLGENTSGTNPIINSWIREPMLETERDARTLKDSKASAQSRKIQSRGKRPTRVLVGTILLGFLMVFLLILFFNRSDDSSMIADKGQGKDFISEEPNRNISEENKPSKDLKTNSTIDSEKTKTEQKKNDPSKEKNNLPSKSKAGQESKSVANNVKESPIPKTQETKSPPFETILYRPDGLSNAKTLSPQTSKTPLSISAVRLDLVDWPMNQTNGKHEAYEIINPKNPKTQGYSLLPIVKGPDALEFNLRSDVELVPLAEVKLRESEMLVSLTGRGADDPEITRLALERLRNCVWKASDGKGREQFILFRTLLQIDPSVQGWAMKTKPAKIPTGDPVEPTKFSFESRYEGEVLLTGLEYFSNLTFRNLEVRCKEKILKLSIHTEKAIHSPKWETINPDRIDLESYYVAKERKIVVKGVVRGKAGRKNAENPVELPQLPNDYSNIYLKRFEVGIMVDNQFLLLAKVVEGNQEDLPTNVEPKIFPVKKGAPGIIKNSNWLDRDNPYKRAKVGDYSTFDMIIKIGGQTITGILTQTVTETTPREVKIQSSSTVNGSESPKQENKIDISKPYDLIQSGAFGEVQNLKSEKLKEGYEKVGVSQKEYECIWRTYKIKGTSQGMETEYECKVWLTPTLPNPVVKMEIVSNVSGTQYEMSMTLQQTGNKKK